MRNVIMCWAASLVLASMATLAAVQIRAPESRILSGNNIGFRVEGTDPSGRPIGRVMVRVNGEWLEVRSPMTVRPVK